MRINLGKRSGTIKLKDHILEQDMTIKQFAEKAGITHLQASRLIGGSHCGMLIAALRVSKLIGKPVDELFGYLIRD